MIDENKDNNKTEQGEQQKRKVTSRGRKYSNVEECMNVNSMR